MPILAAEALLHKNKKKNPVKTVTPSGNRTQASHNLRFPSPTLVIFPHFSLDIFVFM